MEHTGLAGVRVRRWLLSEGAALAEGRQMALAGAGAARGQCRTWSGGAAAPGSGWRSGGKRGRA
jgi:hypothetical protein